MSEALVTFSLGPVQSFIAEARRTQDLWAGSALLSEMTEAAMEAFEKAGGEVIYPQRREAADARAGESPPDRAEGRRDRVESLPNKVVGRIAKDRVAQAMAAAEGAARARLEGRGQEALQTLGQRGVRGFDEAWVGTWRRQIASHLEFFWAAVKLDGNYAGTFQRLNAIFEAAKRSRAFAPAEEPGPKDSLSGRRSALGFAGQDPVEVWRELARRVGPPWLAPDGRDRLDALGVIKRFGFSRSSFPSTSAVASRPFLERARRAAPDELARYREKVRSIPAFVAISGDSTWPFDGDLFYEETLTEARLRSDYDLSPQQYERYRPLLDGAREALGRLYDRVGAQPSTYYAVLVMDGDSMGEHVSLCESRDEHRKLSQLLAGFAAGVRGTVGHFHGALVYAGGDDVLALFPAERALEAAVELARAYNEKLQPLCEPPPGERPHPLPFTCSAGIAFSHHTAPLSVALREARRAEGRAKRLKGSQAEGGKDALAVSVLKRSGEAVEAVARWDDVKRYVLPMGTWFSERKVSVQLASDAAFLAERLGLTGSSEVPQQPPTRQGGAPDPVQLFTAECRRLARRHAAPPGDGVEQRDKLLAEMESWARRLPGGAQQVACWMGVAAFVHREALPSSDPTAVPSWREGALS